MRGMNKAYLMGHIGHEPELRTAASGMAVLKLNVATPGGRKVDGQWVDQPDWHRVTLFEKNAEYVARFAHKGDAIALECTIRPSKWTDRENVVRYEVNLLVDKVVWLSSKPRAVNPDEAIDAAAPPASEPVAEQPPF